MEPSIAQSQHLLYASKFHTIRHHCDLNFFEFHVRFECQSGGSQKRLNTGLKCKTPLMPVPVRERNSTVFLSRINPEVCLQSSIVQVYNKIIAF